MAFLVYPKGRKSGTEQVNFHALGNAAIFRQSDTDFCCIMREKVIL